MLSGSMVRRSSHRLNAVPPYYFLDMPMSGYRVFICDKPSTPEGYQNLARIFEDFYFAQLCSKRAEDMDFQFVFISEVAHVSDNWMEPPHMLVKMTLPTKATFTQVITAHVYYSGSLPDAKYDTATIFWGHVQELAEHEMYALREATNADVDIRTQFNVAT